MARRSTRGGASGKAAARRAKFHRDAARAFVRTPYAGSSASWVTVDGEPFDRGGRFEGRARTHAAGAYLRSLPPP